MITPKAPRCLDQVVAVARSSAISLSRTSRSSARSNIAARAGGRAWAAELAARAERTARSKGTAGAKRPMRSEGAVGTKGPVAAEHRAPFAAGALGLAPGAVHIVIIAIVVHGEILSRWV